jgi:transposase-like protein
VINLPNLIDDAKCFQTVRDLRWPNGVICPHCDSKEVVKDGKDETQPHRQRYDCRSCSRRFDDLTGTVFAGHHRPLQTWILCLYFMGLNLSTYQIARELDLDRGDVQAMTTTLRQGIVERRPEPALASEVECDEVYVTAGHKGNPEAVKKKGGSGAGGG